VEATCSPKEPQFDGLLEIGRAMAQAVRNNPK